MSYHRMCSPLQRKWISDFYTNSEAHHERQVMVHSKIWHKQMSHLYASWGDPIPKSLEIQTSPSPIIELQTDISKAKTAWSTNGPHNRV
jgi:hypothetical protein